MDGSSTYHFSVDNNGDFHQIRDLSHDDFFDWLACSVVLDDSNWEEASGFYREVICRKLVRLGKLRLEGDLYVLPDPEKI